MDPPSELMRMAQPSPHVFDVTTQDFETQVLQKSMETPVIVDFWAPWCQPCRMLGPVLEQVVNEAGGRVVLAKINIDESQDLAMMMRIQSIPAVVAFIEGQPVDHFMGVLPEDQLRKWVGRLLPSRAQELVKEALALEDSDPLSAVAKLQESLAAESSDETKIHLARLMLAAGDAPGAQTLIDELDARGYLEPEAEAIKSQLELRASAEESGGIRSARAAVEADPSNEQLQIALADALAVDGRHAEAFEILLVIIARDMNSDAGKAAREHMVKMFGVLPNGHATVNEYRRKLATLLY